MPAVTLIAPGLARRRSLMLFPADARQRSQSVAAGGMRQNE
jgi:hypothetical protein